MNKYIFVLIVCAVVFLICFLIDTLFKVIFRNPNSKKQAGRPPAEEKRGGRCDPDLRGRRSADQNLAGTPDTLFLIGSIVAIIFGVICCVLIFRRHLL